MYMYMYTVSDLLCDFEKKPIHMEGGFFCRALRMNQDTSIVPSLLPTIPTQNTSLVCVHVHMCVCVRLLLVCV